MSRYNRILVDLLVAAALIAAIIMAAFTIFGRPARGEGVTICAERPGGGKEWWLYRIIDGRKCWFPAHGLQRGQEKPREHLRWQPKPVIDDQPTVNEEEPSRTELIEEAEKPLDFDERWDGTKEGKGDRLK